MQTQHMGLLEFCLLGGLCSRDGSGDAGINPFALVIDVVEDLPRSVENSTAI